MILHVTETLLSLADHAKVRYGRNVLKREMLECAQPGWYSHSEFGVVFTPPPSEFGAYVCRHNVFHKGELLTG